MIYRWATWRHCNIMMSLGDVTALSRRRHCIQMIWAGDVTATRWSIFDIRVGDVIATKWFASATSLQPDDENIWRYCNQTMKSQIMTSLQLDNANLWRHKSMMSPSDEHNTNVKVILLQRLLYHVFFVSRRMSLASWDSYSTTTSPRQSSSPV